MADRRHRRAVGRRLVLPGRLAAVLHVLYLIFNEGHTASGGDRLVDVGEAIRMTRELHGRLPGYPEAAGLLGCWR